MHNFKNHITVSSKFYGKSFIYSLDKSYSWLVLCSNFRWRYFWEGRVKMSNRFWKKGDNKKSVKSHIVKKSNGTNRCYPIVMLEHFQ